MFFVNRRLRVIPDDPTTPDEFSNLALEKRLIVRDALVENIGPIDAFVAENTFHFSESELDTLHAWRHQLRGKFYIFRDLAKYTVFLSATKPVSAYGVLALSQPFEELTGPLPIMVDAVLLPYKGRIVYDGLLSRYSISFGPGLRRSLNECFKEAKARQGIVTSLPPSDNPPTRKTPKAKPAPQPPTKEKQNEALYLLLELLDVFCLLHLNAEYSVSCRQMAEKLARKRPSPLGGNLSAWAAGIVRVVGGVNFLHDKSQTPYMRATDIDQHLHVSPSTGSAKATQIRKLLKIHQLDYHWTLPSRFEDNPLIWLLECNGFMMDIRHAPREVQELAFQKGLIPYIPADRQ